MCVCVCVCVCKLNNNICRVVAAKLFYKQKKMASYFNSHLRIVFFFSQVSFWFLCFNSVVLTFIVYLISMPFS